MLHKFTLRELLNTPEWSKLRATYRGARHPEIWAVSVLLMLQDDGRFVTDETYRNDVVARLYQRFWDSAEDQTASGPETETVESELYLPEELAGFLMQIPQNAGRLLTPAVISNTGAAEAIDRAQKLLAEIKAHENVHLPEPFARISPEAIRRFLSLDRVKRTGWTRTIAAFAPDAETAEQVESVAEHSIKAAFLGICANPEDLGHSFMMGICHDHAEIIVGDIPPQQALSREIKHRMEREAYARMLGEIGESPQTSAFGQLFAAYMDAQTRTARIMHIADKLDMALQALTYENRYHITLEEFLVSATEDILHAWDGV